MKKKYLIVVIGLCLSLCACGKESTESEVVDNYESTLDWVEEIQTMTEEETTEETKEKVRMADIVIGDIEIEESTIEEESETEVTSTEDDENDEDDEDDEEETETTEEDTDEEDTDKDKEEDDDEDKEDDDEDKDDDEEDKSSAKLSNWAQDIYDDLGVLPPDISDWTGYTCDSSEKNNGIWTYTFLQSTNSGQYITVEMTDKELKLIDDYRNTDATVEEEFAGQTCPFYGTVNEAQTVYHKDGIYYRITVMGQEAYSAKILINKFISYI